MSKGLNADQLHETLPTTMFSKTISEIMNKIPNTFKECFDTLMKRFDTKLDNVVYHDDLMTPMLVLTKLNVAVMRLLIVRLMLPWACYYSI